MFPIWPAQVTVTFPRGSSLCFWLGERVCKLNTLAQRVRVFKRVWRGRFTVCLSFSPCARANMRIRRNLAVRGYLTKTELARSPITDRASANTMSSVRTVASRWPIVLLIGLCLLCTAFAEETTLRNGGVLDQSQMAMSTQHIRVACVQRCSDHVSPWIPQ